MAATLGRNGSWWLLAALAVGGLSGCTEPAAPPEVSQNKFRPAGKDGPDKPNPLAKGATEGNGPVDDPAAKPEVDPADPHGKQPVAKGPAANPNVVPDGKPEELFKYVDALEQQLARQRAMVQQAGLDPAEFTKVKTHYRGAQLAAMEKVLLLKEIEPALRAEAARLKLALLQERATDAQGKRDEAGQKVFDEYVEWLLKSEQPELAALGRVGTLLPKFEAVVMKVQGERKAARAKGEEYHPSEAIIADAKQVAGKVDEVLAAKQVTEQEFQVSATVAKAFYDLRLYGAASDIYKAIYTRFKDSDNAELSFRAERMNESAYFSIVMAVANGDTQMSKRMMEELTKLLEKPDGANFRKAYQTVGALETNGQMEEAKAALDLLLKAYATTDDVEVQKELATIKERAEKRFALVGQTINIEGLRMQDGQPFKWADYQGKVVLVDVWATFCEPCLEALPELVQLYEKYHPQGFEIVGVNMDDEPENLPQFQKVLPQFLGIKALPWTNVVQSDPAKSGVENDPNAARLGVKLLPFSVMVGRDGKVIAIQPQGKKLVALLAQEFPNTPEKPAEKAPEGKTPEAKTPEKPASAPVESGALLNRHATTFIAALADEPAAPAAKPAAEEEVNPYIADESLTTLQLVEFLFNMDDRPKAIRLRPGFCEAVCDACDRIVAAQPNAKQREIAVTTKCVYLHRDASLGDEKADKMLVAFVLKMKEDTNPAVARWVRLVELEQEAMAADKLDKAKVPELIAKLHEYFKAEPLANEHLRLASGCVGAINLLEDGEEREKLFKEVGTTLTKAKDKQLASYGKKLAKPPEGEADSEMLGKFLDVKGNLVDGKAFNWKDYRGSYVIVDFWATWCGPCKREIPKLKALIEKLKGKGVEAVGISVDEDIDDVKAFLEENDLPWQTLNSEESSAQAKEWGVRGLPTFMLCDKEGKVIAVSHGVAPLAAKLAKLLEMKP